MRSLAMYHLKFKSENSSTLKLGKASRPGGHEGEEQRVMKSGFERPHHT